MRIGGFQKVSLIDYPGKVAAVVFTQGCNFRCPFCHNVELVVPTCFGPTIDEDEVLAFLTKRVDKLQGVVVTGGEPTLQPDLDRFLQKIKALGYAVKLDTNGSRPEVLQQLLEGALVDYVAMDIKASPEKYDLLCGVPVNLIKIRDSIRLILSSGMPHEFRSTFPKTFLSKNDLPGMLALVEGSSSFRIQPFVPQEKILDISLMDKGQYTDEEFEHLQEILRVLTQQEAC